MPGRDIDRGRLDQKMPWILQEIRHYLVVPRWHIIDLEVALFSFRAKSYHCVYLSGIQQMITFNLRQILRIFLCPSSFQFTG